MKGDTDRDLDDIQRNYNYLLGEREEATAAILALAYEVRLLRRSMEHLAAAADAENDER